MGRVHECITPELQTYIEAQPLFFVATAPLTGEGHVNLSPKGLDCLRILSPRRVAYLDLTGSGNETAAHVTENGRITFMFCAFAGAPRILRLYGTGVVMLPGTPQWADLAGRFPVYPGARQIIGAEITRVQTSCGFGVPRMDVVEQRDTLLRWADGKGSALPRYRLEKNARSIDGLPAPHAGALADAHDGIGGDEQR
jgi:hypothetical protein